MGPRKQAGTKGGKRARGDDTATRARAELAIEEFHDLQIVRRFRLGGHFRQTASERANERERGKETPLRGTKVAASPEKIGEIFVARFASAEPRRRRDGRFGRPEKEVAVKSESCALGVSCGRDATATKKRARAGRFASLYFVRGYRMRNVCPK